MAMTGVGERERETEPTFTVRARDRCSPEIILAWIADAAKAGANGEKLAQAFQVYLRFVAWQRSNGDLVKTPD